MHYVIESDESNGEFYEDMSSETRFGLLQEGWMYVAWYISYLN
jgi:hypothetical protein